MARTRDSVREFVDGVVTADGFDGLRRDRRWLFGSDRR
jgi:hypothetical protein